MVREFELGGKRVVMRASALIPRIYRRKFGRDMLRDVKQLQQAQRQVEKARKAGLDELDQESAALSVMDLEIFENVAWAMMVHGAQMQDVVVGTAEDGSPLTARKLVSGEMLVGDSPEEWLDSLDGVFDVYQVLPIILELWGANLHTTSVPAKK